MKEYKNLMDAPKQTWDNTKINGKNYVVPIVRPLEVGGLAIRRDWLDKLGLKMPTTMDELYTVMKAFKEKEPDGKKVLTDIRCVAMISSTTSIMAPMGNGRCGRQAGRRDPGADDAGSPSFQEEVVR